MKFLPNCLPRILLSSQGKSSFSKLAALIWAIEELQQRLRDALYISRLDEIPIPSWLYKIRDSPDPRSYDGKPGLHRF